MITMKQCGGMIKDAVGEVCLLFTLILRFLQVSQPRLRPPRRTMIPPLLLSQENSKIARASRKGPTEMEASFGEPMLDIMVGADAD